MKWSDTPQEGDTGEVQISKVITLTNPRKTESLPTNRGQHRGRAQGVGFHTSA